MGRSTWTGRTLLYRYGVPTRLHGSGVDVDDATLAQLRLAHELRNKLTELWRQWRDDVDAAWQQHPEVAAAHERAVAAAEKVKDAEDAVAESRQQRRSKHADPDVKRQLTQARREARETRQAEKAAKQSAYEALKPTLDEAKSAYQAAVKATYREFVDRGLYWPTYNLVRDQHNRAEQAVRRAWRDGRPAQLRFRRWQGEGSVAVQLQRESGQPPRSPALLASGEGSWRNVVRLPPQMAATPEEWAARPSRRAGRLGRIAVRIGSDERRQPVWAELPVVVHRPLPVDADVTGVRLTRRRVGGGHRLQVEVTVTLPDPEPATHPGLVALDTGWRVLDDGSVRVAAWTSCHADPLRAADIPHHLTEAIRPHPGGYSGEVAIPASWVDELERLDAVRATRDKNHNLAVQDLIGWFEEDPSLVDTLDVTPTQARQWRAHRHLVRTAQRAADELGTDHPLAQRLEGWRKQDKHLWEWHAHATDQLVNRRVDLYRVVAARLCDRVGVAAVKADETSRLARRPDVGEDDTYQGERARRYARIAAPGSLLSTLRDTASRRGVAVVDVDAAGTSTTHHGCGGELPLEQRRKDLRVRCPACDALVDQDHNAAANVILAARQQHRPE